LQEDIAVDSALKKELQSKLSFAQKAEKPQEQAQPGQQEQKSPEPRESSSSESMQEQKPEENPKPKPRQRKSLVEGTAAERLSKGQRDISVAEFFEKNRHLLGFDNKRKALLTTIKEAMDNALDACEEAEVLPEVYIEIISMGQDRFRIIIEDNGPGIVKKNIPFVFAKLLYGSKFHSLRQNRGQQGIGISAVVLYAQLTSGRPTRITSKIGENHSAHYYELRINTLKNQPEIIKDEIREWEKPHGTRIELDLEASYYKGAQSVDEYIKQTAIVNPHATIIYVTPDGEQKIYARASEALPRQPKSIKPHPYGVELGILMKMLASTTQKTVSRFLCSDFSRVTSKTANEILKKASIEPNSKPKKLTRDEAERIIDAIRSVKIMAPPSDCISPIKEDLIEKGLKKEINAEFYTVVSRPPSVYRGYPFIIEAGLAYGGNMPKDTSASVLRFANRIPLLYQAGSCSFTKTVIATDWRNYGLSQPRGSLPVGPLLVLIHIASVWVPYTSEAKEAIASYPEIIKEVKLAMQELGRKLSRYLSKKKSVQDEIKKRGYIEKYIPHIALAIDEMLDIGEPVRIQIEERLKDILEKKRGKIEKIDFDEDANKEYDEEFAVKRTGAGILDDDYLEEETPEKEANKKENNEKQEADEKKQGGNNE